MKDCTTESLKETGMLSNRSHFQGGHREWVRHFVQLPDSRIVTGSDDHTLIIWDADGNHLQQLTGHADVLTCVAALSHGRIISGDVLGTAIVWDGNGEKFQQFDSTEGGYVSCAIPMNDDSVVICTVRLGIETRMRILDISGSETHHRAQMSIRCGLQLWSGKLITECHTTTLRDRAESQYHRLVDHLGAIAVWDTASPGLSSLTHRSVAGHDDRVTSLIQHHDGTVVSTSTDHHLILWDDDMNVLCRCSTKTPVWSVAVLRDRRMVSGHQNGEFISWSCTGQQLDSYTVPLANRYDTTRPVVRITQLKDGRLAVCHNENWVDLWNITVHVPPCEAAALVVYASIAHFVEIGWSLSALMRCVWL